MITIITTVATIAAFELLPFFLVGIRCFLSETGNFGSGLFGFGGSAGCSGSGTGSGAGAGSGLSFGALTGGVSGGTWFVFSDC